MKVEKLLRLALKTETSLSPPIIARFPSNFGQLSMSTLVQIVQVTGIQSVKKPRNLKETVKLFSGGSKKKFKKNLKKTRPPHDFFRKKKKKNGFIICV